MKKYSPPCVEILGFTSDDVLTSSSLSDIYRQNGSDIDCVSWADKIEQ